MEYCKKLTSWDIYGVRKFPYPGTRKYSPGVHRTFNGSIVIQNDVFGMTIHQFEREFKGCLARRKQHQERIQNIRFPNKTTNAYIEYLTYGDTTVEDHNLSYQHRSYCNLIQVAGTELEIRTRQRMFIGNDKIYKASGLIYISSGSLAEGIDLPGSDVDIMVECPITVIQDLKYMFSSIRQTIFLMECDVKYPGFCKLKLVAEGYGTDQIISDSLKETDNGIYISTEKFVLCLCTLPQLKSDSRHGPCLSDANQYRDIAFCFRSKYWPTYALHWIHRHRTGQWPTKNVVYTIVNEGCLFVPIGPKDECNELLWRISFSLAEKRLSHSMNYTQLLCYVLMKLTLKNIINKHEDVKEVLCSYFLKTTLFWLSEEICIDTFKLNNLSYCFSLCIGKLMSFVSNCHCPNYFIPQHNMFVGKVDESNNKLLLSILSELRNTELQLIINVIFGNNIINHSVCSMINKTILSVNLDLLFYRVAAPPLFKDIDSGYKTLQYINSFMESESSDFIHGVLTYYHARINQEIPQKLVLPEQRHKRYNVIRCCYKHLTDGTKSDATSGWVLYASFYYVLGKYTKTLQVVDNVLSRCTPDMIRLRQPVYTTEDINKYKHKTHSCLTLKHKMTQATSYDVVYIKQSTMIPQELQLEVQDTNLFAPPVVMCQCLQFLCYHHLGDAKNKHRALRELYLTIKYRYFVSECELSESLVILGVCHELSDDKDSAFHCYSEALKCEHYVCPSAEQRIQNLFI